MAPVNGSSPSSSSSAAIFQVSYGSGSAEGHLVSDTVSMAGYSLPNQTFASCDSVTPGLLAGNVSGIMGLGFEKIASSGKAPFWENLAKQNQMADGEMGFAFTRFLHDPDSANAVEPGGVMSFGKANRTLYDGNISWNNLTETGYWLIGLQDVEVNGTKLAISSNAVAIDTYVLQLEALVHTGLLRPLTIPQRHFSHRRTCLCCCFHLFPNPQLTT